MKIKLIIRAFALAALLAISACESDEPATTSTTVTEETTSVHPVRVLRPQRRRRNADSCLLKDAAEKVDGALRAHSASLRVSASLKEWPSASFAMALGARHPPASRFGRGTTRNVGRVGGCLRLLANLLAAKNADDAHLPVHDSRWRRPCSSISFCASVQS